MTPNVSPKVSAAPVYPDSMDLDAVLQRPRGPLSASERAYQNKVIGKLLHMPLILTS